MNSIAFPFEDVRYRPYWVVLLSILSILASIVLSPRLGMLVMAIALAISLPKVFAVNLDEKNWYIAIPVVVLLILVGVYVKGIVQWIQLPPLWDFGAFWTDGRVASQGLNFYDPSAYKTVLGSIPKNEAFVQEIVNVGFNYPPPTMFLFVFLGWLDIRSAVVVWYSIMLSFLGGSVYLLSKQYFQNEGVWGLLVTICFLLLLWPSYQTLFYGQTNFAVLFFFLLGLRQASSKSVGVWWCLASVIKPYMAILVVPIILRRNWKALFGFFVLWICLILVACLAFGWQTCLSYITSNPVHRTPSFVYSETVNQSLLGTIIRLTNNSSEIGTLIIHLTFLVAALTICALSLMAIVKAKTKKDDVTIVIVLLCGLLIYPGTLSHYAVMLVVSMFELLRLFGRMFFSKWIGISVVICTFAFANSGQFAFWGFLCSWLALVYLVLVDNRKIQELLV